MRNTIKHSFKYRFFILLFFIFSHFFIHSVQAYPLTEKTPASGSAPLDILSSQPNRIVTLTFGDFKDEFMFVIDGSTSLTLVDLDVWDSYTTQPDTFTADVVDAGVLENGTSVIVALSDGDLARIELDDEDTFADTDSSTTDDLDTGEDAVTDSRQINLSTEMTTAGITRLIADPDQDVVYMINDSGYFFEYNLNTNTFTETELTNSEAGTTTTTDSDGEIVTTSSVFTPTDLVFASSTDGDKIIISTTTGDLITLTPGSSSFSVVNLSDSLSSTNFDDTTPDLVHLTVTPSGNYIYAIDSDNDAIWVYSIITGEFIDKDSSTSYLSPIEISTDVNTGFSDLLSFEDASGDVVTYVSGSLGISVIDSDSPSDATDPLVDAITSDGLDDEDPITVSGTPGPLATSSADAGYVFSANGDATISVFTDNPWITLSSIEPSSVTEDSSSFVLTFQTDTAGTYTVMANSNPSGSTGTELIAATSITEVNTDTTTESIDINSYSRETFIEGTNKIFVHVTDASGNIGHTAIYLTVDRPPEALTITGVNFGNKKVFVDFTPSPDADIAAYNIFAEPAADQTNPTCDSSLTFDTSDTVSGSVDPTGCSTTVCEGGIESLTNDVAYCVAVQAVDAAGQESDLSAFTTAVTPEQTVGPAAFLGEVSCSLSKNSLSTNRNNNSSPLFLQIILFASPILFSILFPTLFFSFLKLRHRKNFYALFFTCFFICVCFSFQAQAKTTTIPEGEKTPKHWTTEVKGTIWYPTDSAVRSLIGACCNFDGEVAFGWLYKDRLNITFTAGFGLKNGNAVALSSGTSSGDTYSLLFVPMRLDMIYRFNYKTNQLFLPYALAGVDTVYFHESSDGESIQNIKYGLHAGGGVGILLDHFESMDTDLEKDIGVNDVYLTFEARYAMINSFKSSGLDLSGLYPYVGLLFEF